MINLLWWIDHSWTSGAHKTVLSLLSSAAQGEERENKMEKFVGQDKGSVTEQEQMLERQP